jgi:D-ribose pyranose/furanose isomerase RbsD
LAIKRVFSAFGQGVTDASHTTSIISQDYQIERARIAGEIDTLEHVPKKLLDFFDI